MVNKYGAKSVEVDGIKFASKREAERYSELKWLEKAGQIRCLDCHPQYELIVNGKKIGKYTADFQYYDQEKGFTIEDVKGKITEAASLRIRLFNALYNTKVRIIK